MVESLTPDGIPYCFIRKIAAEIASPLEIIFNLCFMRTQIPDRWKEAYVFPLPKKPPYSEPNNFRPVSITSLFCRLFEKIMKESIVRHLDQHSIIPASQHGFSTGKSTITQMLESLNDWTLAMSQKQNVDIIYFDFEKAFDKVPHGKLLRKLHVLGLHPKIIEWIREFLTNRCFRVHLNNTFSSPRVICSGVPQGSVLSPVLFTIYAYDLPESVSSFGVQCKMFADDVKIYKSVSCEEDARNLQLAINTIVSWSNGWNLPLSATKTKVLHLGAG